MTKMTVRCRICMLFVLLTAFGSIMSIVGLTSSAEVTGRSEANRVVGPAFPNGSRARGLGYWHPRAVWPPSASVATDSSLSTLEEGHSSSWTEIQFGTKKIGSTRFHSFLLNIYNDTSNQGPNSFNNRYFYAPVSFLNINDVHCASYADGHAHEVVVSLTMWDDESELSAARYLNSLLCKRNGITPLGCPISDENVEIIPFEQIRILKKKSANKAQFYGCTLDSSWHSYQGQQVVEFTMSCLEQQACKSLAKEIQEKPRRYANHLQVALRLTSMTTRTKTKRIQVTSLLGGVLAARIDQQFRKKGQDVERALLTAEVYRKLLQEASTNIIIDTFDDSDDFVDDWTLNNVIQLLDRFLDSSETWIREAAGDASWETVFWMEENYRPDKIAATLNKVYKELDTKDKKYLEGAFSGTSKDDLNVSGKVAGEGYGFKAEVSADVSTSKETSNSTSGKTKELNKILENGKELVKWDGEKFVPKEMVLVGINLAHLRDTRSLTDQQVRVRYAPSVLTAPLNIPLPANEVRESFLRDIERDIYGNISSLESKIDKSLEAGSAKYIFSVKSEVEKLDVRTDRLEVQNAKFLRLHSELTEAAGTQKNRSILEVLRRQMQGLDVVAFDVYRNTYFSLNHRVIPYQGALVNIGGAIKPEEGVFRAPYAGVYAFNLHFDEPGVSTECRIQIRVNGNAIATVYKDGPSNSGTGESVVVKLAVGDTVDTYVIKGDFGYDADSHFAGFLISEIF